MKYNIGKHKQCDNETYVQLDLSMKFYNVRCFLQELPAFKKRPAERLFFLSGAKKNIFIRSKEVSQSCDHSRLDCFRKILTFFRNREEEIRFELF